MLLTLVMSKVEQLDDASSSSSSSSTDPQVDALLATIRRRAMSRTSTGSSSMSGSSVADSCMTGSDVVLHLLRHLVGWKQMFYALLQVRMLAGCYEA